MTSRSAEKEAFWRLVVDEQKASELSVRAFCRQESVSEPSFYAWRKELQRRDQAQQDQAQQEGSLIPVNVVDQFDTTQCDRAKSASPGHFEVETPNGFKLRFDQQLEAARLLDVLQVVASCQRDDRLAGGASC